jgi:hypothetical protein
MNTSELIRRAVREPTRYLERLTQEAMRLREAGKLAHAAAIAHTLANLATEHRLATPSQREIVAWLLTRSPTTVVTERVQAFAEALGDEVLAKQAEVAGRSARQPDPAGFARSLARAREVWSKRRRKKE